MANIDELLTKGQIATTLLIIAFVLVFLVFGRCKSETQRRNKIEDWFIYAVRKITKVITVTLSESQYKALSEISRDIAQVSFAALVVTPLVAGLDKVDWRLVVFGLINSFTFW